MKRENEPSLAVPGQWRTARKLHTCERCHLRIIPGERYFEYTGEVPAFQTGSAYCRDCALTVWPRDEAQENDRPLAATARSWRRVVRRILKQRHRLDRHTVARAVTPAVSQERHQVAAGVCGSAIDADLLLALLATGRM
jgi:hypothetical protein